jgi:hypothetical protein
VQQSHGFGVVAVATIQVVITAAIIHPFRQPTGECERNRHDNPVTAVTAI